MPFRSLNPRTRVQYRARLVELLLVRHGLPNRSGATDAGRADPGLSAAGHAEAQAVAAWLVDERVDAVYSSPLLRARETAAPLAQALGVSVVIDEDLAEWDRDADAYLHIEDLQRTNDPIWQAMASGDLEALGIDPVHFRRRVVDALDGIAAAHPSQVVTVACHGGVINAYTAAVAGLDRILWFSPDYGGISRIRVSRRGVRSIVSLNETGHLRGLTG